MNRRELEDRIDRDMEKLEGLEALLDQHLEKLKELDDRIERAAAGLLDEPVVIGWVKVAAWVAVLVFFWWQVYRWVF